MTPEQPARREFIIAADGNGAAHEAAELFVEEAKAAIARHGRFNVALSGGSTPKITLALLATAPYVAEVDWANVHFFWSDERSVGPESAESNYRMAREALLQQVVPPAQEHRLQGELAPAEAARLYEEEIRREFASQGNGKEAIPAFDLIYLGMGPDGHTASLFPGTTGLQEQQRLVVENHVAKLNTDRLTFSAPLINAARHVAFLVVGADKAAVLAEVVAGPRDTERLPSQLIAPRRGMLTFIIDRAAATNLDPAILNS